MKDEYYKQWFQENFPILRMFLSFLSALAQNSPSLKKVVALSFGLLLLYSIPFVNLAYANTIIPVGTAPIELDFVESLNLIFVANQVDNTISVIDTDPANVLTFNTVIATFPSGNIGSVSAIHPLYVETATTKLLYVSHQGSNDIAVIDRDPANVLTFNTVINTISLLPSAAPFDIDYNPNNKQIYSANSFSNDVTVIDADPVNVATFNTVVKTIPAVGQIAPIGLIVNPNTNFIYFTNLFTNTVLVIDGTTDTIVATIPVDSAGGISVDEAKNRILVAGPTTNTLSIIDADPANVLTFNTVIKTIPVGNGPRTPAVNTVTDLIFVPNNNGDTLTIIDGSTFGVIGAIPVGDGPFGPEVNEDTNLIYLIVQNDNAVEVIDLSGNFPPTANAGPDQVVDEGSLVQLDGSGSSDFNGDNITFEWSQITGPAVTLSDPLISNPTFDALNVDVATILGFELIVTDDTLDMLVSLPDTVRIVVRDTTTFTVPLNVAGDQLTGNIIVQDFPANSQITFDLLTPAGSIINGALDETKVTSLITGTNVEVGFTVLPRVPLTFFSKDTIKDPALYFEIDVKGIDFSSTVNIPPDNIPKAKFFVSKDYETDAEFSDGCPVVPFFRFNEKNKFWEQLGDPVLPNSNRIHVSDSINGDIIVIDGNTNEEITRIDVGFDPRESIFEPNLNKIYTATLGNGVVTVINALDNSIITTLTGLAGVSPIDLDPTQNKLFAATFGPGLVHVIDTTTDTVDPVPIVSGGTGLSNLRINPGLNKAYITDITVNQLIVIDTITNNVIDAVPLPGIAGSISINLKNNLVYIPLFSTNEVAVIDGSTHAILELIPVGLSPVGSGVNQFTNKIFVANAGSGTVSVIDGNVNAVVGETTLNVGILGLSVNQNTDRVYVTNQAFGTVDIIDGSSFELLDTLVLGPGIFTTAFNDKIPNPVRDPASDNGNLCANLGETDHLSKFAIGGVRALFIIGGGGVSSHGGSAPVLNSISYDGVTTTNDDGTIEFGGVIIDKILPINNLPTQTVEKGELFKLRLPFYEDNGVGSLQHVAVYLLRGDEKTIYDSQTSIIYKPNDPVEISDPPNFISNVRAEGIVKSAHDVDIIFEMVFNFPTDEPVDIKVHSWDKSRRSSEITFIQFLQVVESGSEPQLPVNTSNELTSSWTKSVESSAIKSTTIFKEEFDGTPVTFDMEGGQSVTKNFKIPLWVKNNASWWSYDEISDDDFVAGIRYLIDQNVIPVPDRNIVSILEPIHEIVLPDWVKSNAGWWADDLVSDQEFVHAIKWLIDEGVMSV